MAVEDAISEILVALRGEGGIQVRLDQNYEIVVAECNHELHLARLLREAGISIEDNGVWATIVAPVVEAVLQEGLSSETRQRVRLIEDRLHMV